MVAILPDEILDLINNQHPCRELQARTLLSLYNNTYPPPPLAVAYGLESAHKLPLITTILSARHIPHAIVKCRECLSQRHLLGKIFSSCAKALGPAGSDDDASFLEQFDRVDSINSLAVNLERLASKTQDARRGKRRCVLVLDSVDEVRGAVGPTLLAALGRLGDLIPSLSLLLTTCSPRPLPLHRSGVPYIHFPPYTRSEAVAIVTTAPNAPAPLIPESLLAADLKAEELDKIFKQFAVTVYDALIAPTTRSMVVYRQTLERLWPRFVWPAVSGEVPPGKQGRVWDFSRLLVRNRGLFGAAGEAALLGEDGAAWTFDELMREQEDKASQTAGRAALPMANHGLSTTQSRATTAAVPTTVTTTSKPLLSPLPALLLLAIHLCSTTPAKHDILLFSRLSSSATKHRKIRYIKRGNPGATPKKANEDGRRKDKTKSLAPKATSLERVLAVARGVSGEVVGSDNKGWSDRCMRAVGELERLRLVRREDGVAGGGGGGGADGDGVAASTSVGVMGGGRWRVNVGRETVVEMVKGFGLGVAEWELDL